VLWSLCAALTGSLRRGLAAVSAVALLGHFEPLRQWFVPDKGTTVNLLGIDWWKTSRVIPDTINEYPAFTMLIGDAHAHFFALPPAAVFFCLCHSLLATHDSASAPKQRNVVLIVLGLLLGTVIMTNTWDVPALTLLGVLVTALALRRDENTKPWHWLLIFVPPVVARVAAWPYLKDFESPVQGVRFEVWSPPWTSFLLLWGGFVLLWIVALQCERRRLGRDEPLGLLRHTPRLGVAAITTAILLGVLWRRDVLALVLVVCLLMVTVLHSRASEVVMMKDHFIDACTGSRWMRGPAGADVLLHSRRVRRRCVAPPGHGLQVRVAGVAAAGNSGDVRCPSLLE
jgi:uncharacterized membrane protein